MKTIDLKIRLSGEHAQSWIDYYLSRILAHDWESQAIGVHNFAAISALDCKDKRLAQLSLYRTKTQRVAYICADVKCPV